MWPGKRQDFPERHLRVTVAGRLYVKTAALSAPCGCNCGDLVSPSYCQHFGVVFCLQRNRFACAANRRFQGQRGLIRPFGYPKTPDTVRQIPVAAKDALHGLHSTRSSSACGGTSFPKAYGDAGSRAHSCRFQCQVRAIRLRLGQWPFGPFR